MARSQQLTESANYRRLEANYPKLKRDKSHRRAFHKFIENTFIKHVDKPTTYKELERAYLNFR
jgi:hypothetical protein